MSKHKKTQGQPPHAASDQPAEEPVIDADNQQSPATEELPVSEAEQEVSAADAGKSEEPIDAESDLAAQLQEAKAKIAKLKDGYMRAKAEEENVRRRSEREIANSRKFAIEGFAKEMLTVHDSLKLACETEIEDESQAAIAKIQEGVEITLKQLHAAFAKFALHEINPEVGEKLDPNLHQAMSMIESKQVESGCIIEVLTSGFQLHDRLIRPAMVVVAK